MAKRSTRIETTKIFNDGSVTVTTSKNKMNRRMCEEVIQRLTKDCESLSDSDIEKVTFKCVD